MSRIIAIANQKGGTAKSSSAINLSAALAGKGNRVLLVDADPQANLTLSFGIERPDELIMSMHNVLTILMEGQALPDKAEYVIQGDKIDIIPGNINLAATEINLRNELGGERVLSELLETLRSEYDFIIIDCNPYLGLLTVNALSACDEVLIPVSPQFWSATGLVDLLDTVGKVKRKINSRIEVGGILLTMCDERTKLYREVKALLDEHFGSTLRIFNTVIPYSTKVGEANLHSKSIIDYAPDNKAAQAYIALAEEVLNNGK